MKSASGTFRPVGTQRICVVLLTVFTLASSAFAQTFSAGEKAKVKGTIMSRKGDLIKIQDDKTGSRRWSRSLTIRKLSAINPR